LKTLIKRKLLIIALVGFTLPVIFLFYFIFQSSSQRVSTSPTANTTALYKQGQANLLAGQMGSGLPTRLKIPSINVDAVLEYVGIAPDGAMDIPKSPDDIAWFELGIRPGEKGSAVVAGHYGWKNGRAAVFDNLHKLRKGDKLYVEDNKGVIVSFVVREFRSYDPKADSSDVFNSDDGKSHLNLITCEGVWNKTQKSYSKRLVVFTDKEIE